MTSNTCRMNDSGMRSWKRSLIEFTQIEALLVGVAGDIPPALSECLRVAVRAARRNLVATRNGVPSRVRPLDCAVVGQGYDSFVLASLLPARYRTYVRLRTGRMATPRRTASLDFPGVGVSLGEVDWRGSARPFAPLATVRPRASLSHPRQ